MAIKTGDIVTINKQDQGVYVVIGQAKGGGYWLQGENGELPIARRPYVSGFMPRELTVIGHYGMSN